MTKEEKEVLVKDLCGRLPYVTRVRYTYAFDGIASICGYSDEGILSYNKLQDFSQPTPGYERSRVVCILPYLRPLASMTEEEINEFILISDTVLWLGDKKSTCILSLEQMDWLSANYFDYRGLIGKGLAIEAPEGMYNI